MDALAVVANVGIQNEVYALRKLCFLPHFLALDQAFWNGEVDTSPPTLSAAIMEHSYKHSPRDALTRLSALCNTHGLPVPGDWATCEQASSVCNSNWTDHMKLFLYLGLLRDGDQDHKTWTDAIFEHPGLRARQLVNVLNDMSVGFTYSDDNWGREKWPFSMDAEINPTSE